jgi:hypothetical protein
MSAAADEFPAAMFLRRKQRVLADINLAEATGRSCLPMPCMPARKYPAGRKSL